MTEHRLSMWTVYDHPADCPGVFIARRYEVGRPNEGDHGVIPTDDTIESRLLGEVRAKLADRGLVCLSRSPHDDPNIIETWL